MASEKLTKRVVDGATAEAGRYVKWDSAIKGFGLRVFPSGEKSWIFEYRPGGGSGPKKRLTIGRAGELTPDQARRKADELRSQVKLGGDPQADRIRKRQALSFAEVASLFLTEHVEAKRKASTAADYRDVFERLLVPKLGPIKAVDVTRGDVARIHFSLKATPYQANRMLAAVSSMYSFADRQGLVKEDFNPARRIERYRETGRERLLSEAELSRLGAVILEAETTGIPWTINPDGKTQHLPKTTTTVIDPFAAAALRLLIFTGARLGEILHLKWEHVDFERGLLRLPDSKTGKKTIVLNAPALEVLAGIPKMGAYVIAGATAATAHEKPRADLKRPWASIKRHAGLDDVRIHDLRHNFASVGAGGGMGLPIIGKLLGHSQPSTTARYAHLDADPLRKASEAIGAHLSATMKGEKRDKGNVVQLGRNR